MLNISVTKAWHGMYFPNLGDRARGVCGDFSGGIANCAKRMWIANSTECLFERHFRSMYR